MPPVRACGQETHRRLPSAGSTRTGTRSSGGSCASAASTFRASTQTSVRRSGTSSSRSTARRRARRRASRAVRRAGIASRATGCRRTAAPTSVRARLFQDRWTAPPLFAFLARGRAGRRRAPRVELGMDSRRRRGLGGGRRARVARRGRHGRWRIGAVSRATGASSSREYEASPPATRARRACLRPRAVASCEVTRGSSSSPFPTRRGRAIAAPSSGTRRVGNVVRSPRRSPLEGRRRRAGVPRGAQDARRARAAACGRVSRSTLPRFRDPRVRGQGGARRLLRLGPREQTTDPCPSHAVLSSDRRPPSPRANPSLGARVPGQLVRRWRERRHRASRKGTSTWARCRRSSRRSSSTISSSSASFLLLTVLAEGR